MKQIILDIKDMKGSKESALRFVDKINEEIQSLDFLPYRHPIYEQPPFDGMGLQFLSVKKYNVLYTIDEDEKTVWIMRIYSARRDPENISVD